MFAERLICSWIGAFGLAAGAFCQTYVQFSIDAGPIPGSINQKGEIAGTYVDFANGFHGFVRDPGGKITAFDAPGSFSSTRAISINAGGAITGTFIDTTPPVVRTRAYVRDPEGNFTTFDPPGSVSTVPQSINARGAISGYYNESNQRLFGFVLQPNGKITSIDPPGSISTQAFGINAKGAITGYYSDGHGTHGFLREPTGTIISFDVPEGTGTFPASINDAGAITGSYINPGPFPGSVPRTFGFVRDPDGNFTSFDPGPRDTIPQIINNEGAIAGFLEDLALDIFHGFVRSPEGTSTVFDPPFCFPGSTITGSILDKGSGSMNDKGVIVGACSLLTPPFPTVGWVRFP